MLLASEPEIPAAAERAWQLFWDLQRQRTSGGMAANPIDARMILDHCRLMRIDVMPWEANAVLDMDSFAYWQFQSDKSKNRDAPPMMPATGENIRDVFKNLKGSKNG